MMKLAANWSLYFTPLSCPDTTPWGSVTFSKQADRHQPMQSLVRWEPSRNCTAWAGKGLACALWVIREHLMSPVLSTSDFRGLLCGVCSSLAPFLWKEKLWKHVENGLLTASSVYLTYLFCVPNYTITADTDIQVLITDNSNSISQTSLIRPTNHHVLSLHKVSMDFMQR